MAIGESLFAPGDPCGVCQFPTDRGKVCGNVVYANEPKGRLPRYCGQEGQAKWQAQHGTEGNPKHLSDRAKYWRDTYGMSSPEEAAKLAEAEAARRGIGRRSETPDAAESEPVLTVVPTVPEESEPTSAIEALADLATALTGRVTAVREEMDEVRAECEARMTELDAERERLTAEVEAEKQALAEDRETAQNTTERAKLDVREATERAENAIREATESRLKTEGELKSARERIKKLEQQLTDMTERHKREIEDLRKTHKNEIENVRKVESDRFRETMRDFALTIRHEQPAEADRPEPTPTPQAIADLTKWIVKGVVTRRNGRWHTGNGWATNPAARTLDWMLSVESIAVGEGDPAPVTMTGK